MIKRGRYCVYAVNFKIVIIEKKKVFKTNDRLILNVRNFSKLNSVRINFIINFPKNAEHFRNINRGV